MAWDPRLPVLVLLSLGGSPALGGMDSCYDPAGAPQYCLPGFENAAFLRELEVSNTCGSPPEDYCMQMGPRGGSAPCHRCDALHPALQHNASALTDPHSAEDPSWWQSQSMAAGVQHPSSVNLTLHLGKAYEITYVRLRFHTSRPESFAIYKRSRADGPWVPYQYYSASCQKTYGRREGLYLHPGDDEAVPFCTAEFSDISPLSGGNVAFSTLEGRPGAYNFDRSPILQDWVTSTDLLISLNRLNTFGDDIFKDKKVLQSYFYAISDLSVGGRCKCNGHASECVSNPLGQLTCNCQHNTTGVDCELCQPFYQDRPWARGTSETANECRTCECHGHSEECIFDPDLFRHTSHGGHCQNCRDHTAGPHCEHCLENFYREDLGGTCLPCHCSPTGSLNLQCDSKGICNCKPSVTGWKCDRCRQGYHSFSEGGCRPCSCHPAGTVGECHPQSGRCLCKANVEGHLCDRCVSGTFNLQPQDPRGCTPCFCFGHSSVCTTAPGYGVYVILSNFTHGPGCWRGEGPGGQEIPVVWAGEEIALNASSGEEEEEENVYFVAPRKFLGDQLLSYGQTLTLRVRVPKGETGLNPISLILDGAGRRLSVSPSSSSDCTTCGPQEWEILFRLSAEEDYGTEISRPSFHFQRLLSNLTALRIALGSRANNKVFLRQVTLTSASPGLAVPAAWVEQCTCPPGYMGQFCQACAPGYTRVTPSGGPLVSCVPCTCNQHGICDPNTGHCHCLHRTEGASCQRCMDGFYGDPFRGRPDDCQPCPCPDSSSCALMPAGGEVVCTNCPPGQIGRRCQICDDGLFGDPLVSHGPPRPCSPCDCSGNIDPNAPGNCDPLSGECLRCLHNTAGDRCQRCREGFYGNALAQDHGRKCAPCNCHQAGSAGDPQTCDPVTGRCECLPHVIGRECDQCRPGSFGMKAGIGCHSCVCDPVGSQHAQCDAITGQCVCHMGVEGVSCQHCHNDYFGFSSSGCRPCNCSPLGSITSQCHGNGTCTCRRGFVGYKCDQCQQNFYYSPAQADCEECPTCYSLVKDQANKLKTKLDEMEVWLSKPECSSSGVPYSHQWTPKDFPRGDALPESYSPQGAKELFLEYIGDLESSVSSAWKQLRGRTNTTCTDHLEQKSCNLLSELDTTLESVQREAGQAAGTLRAMAISQDFSMIPSDWSHLVTKLRILAERQRDIAAEVTATASAALVTSNTSYELLHRVLKKERSQEEREELEDRYQDIQSAQAEFGGALKKAMSDATRTAASVRQVNAEQARHLSALSASVSMLLDGQTMDLSTGATDLSTGAMDLSTGAMDLNTGAMDLSTGATDLSTGTMDMSTGATDLNTGATDLNTGATDLSTGAMNLSTGAMDLSTGAMDLNTRATDLNTGATNLNTRATDLNTGATNLNTGAMDLNTGATNMNTGATDLSTEATDLSTGTTDLSHEATDLRTGAMDMSTGATYLSTGTMDVSTGATDLSTGATDLSTEAIHLSTQSTHLSTQGMDLNPGATELSSRYMVQNTGARDLIIQLEKAEKKLVTWNRLLQEMALSQEKARQQLEKASQSEKLSHSAHSAFTVASSAVAEGEMAAKEAASLLSTMEEMARDIVSQKNQGAALRKRKMAVQKETVEAVKKSKQAERMMGNATSVSATSKQLAQEAESTATKSVMGATELLSEGKREHNHAATLARTTAETLAEVQRQDGVSNTIKRELDEAELLKVEVTTVRKTLKRSRVSLEKDVSMLSRLLRSLEDVPSEGQYEAVLSSGLAQLEEAKRRLSRPGTLESKMEALQHEAQQQKLKLQDYEAQIEIIRAEKDNLEDIVHTLPGGCSG